jgi:hypothetical protein
MLLLNKSKIYTFSLKYSICPFWLERITITLLFGHHLLWGKHILTKWRTGKPSADHTTDDNTELTESFSASAGLHDAHVRIKMFWFWNFFWFWVLFFDCTWSDPCVMNPRIRRIYCINVCGLVQKAASLGLGVLICKWGIRRLLTSCCKDKPRYGGNSAHSLFVK